MTTIGLAIPSRQAWSAVGAMALCVAMLIASEFMPVSLLTPIATDLHATDGLAGQAISVSGLFAVITSLFIATIARRLDRRYVLLGLTGLMLASLILIAEAPGFEFLMTARALLGITIGGFWSLATANIMRLVPEDSGGGLIVGAIQLSILLCAAFGGLLLDHISIAATLIGGTVLLTLTSLVVGNSDRIKPPKTNKMREEFRLSIRVQRDGTLHQQERLPCASV